jgi:hypothetical protein
MSNPEPPPRTVLIDGTRYVPVRAASPSAAILENVIVSQWAGDNWRESYPDAPGYLRVIITDDQQWDEGETVTEFLARLVQALPRSLPASSLPE